MTTEIDNLVAAALAAADLFREGDTPEHPEIRGLVRAADAYLSGPSDKGDANCLICSVRALTEGEPNTWWPGEPGASVAGVILKVDRVKSQFADLQTTDGTVPFIDLWTGNDRIRVIGYGRVLQMAMKAAAPAVGDRAVVTFTHWGAIERGRFAGQKFRVITVTVERGHH